MTTYVVLKSTATTGPWTPLVGTFDAASAKQAITAAAQAPAAKDAEGKHYLAIPAKSYRTYPVTVETVQRVKVGG